MNFLRNFGAALVASCFAASSAAAVTVTHTGTVSYISSAKATANVAPLASQTIRKGDSFTLTYSINEAAPVAEDRSHLGSKAQLFDLSSISISFSSGFATSLSPHRIGVYSSSNPLRGEEYLSFDLQHSGPRTGISQVPTNTLFAAFDPVVRPGPSFSGSLTEIVSNISGFAFKYGNYFADPSSIGATSADCGGAHFCYVSFHSLSAGAISNGTNPQPPVSPVPVPAPFLMLGMAMAGLAGFGRRARA